MAQSLAEIITGLNPAYDPERNVLNTQLGALVVLILRHGDVLPILTMHDVEHALTILVSHEKVFGVMSAVTNRKSICRPTIGWDAM